MKFLLELLLGTLLAASVCVLLVFGWLVMWR